MTNDKDAAREARRELLKQIEELQAKQAEIDKQLAELSKEPIFETEKAQIRYDYDGSLIFESKHYDFVQDSWGDDTDILNSNDVETAHEWSIDPDESSFELLEALLKKAGLI